MDQMFHLVRDLNPDVMVIAGDVFHHRQPGEEALELFHHSLNRFLNLGTTLIFLAGPSDDFRPLHLDGRWVKEAGIHLIDDVTQVLSPMSFSGARDNFEVKTWCLPYPRGGTSISGAPEHPALVGHRLVEKVVQRLDPGEINVFVGYAWAQDGGRVPEFGPLIQPGGQPLEKRLLEFFDVAALGGRHQPLRLGTLNAYYSGSLLCYEAEAQERGRSVTVYEITGKNQVYIDHYPLRPRRNLKVLEGSWEELMDQGSQLRTDDLVVLRSEEKNLSPEQRADLRILSPNVVSVELPSPFAAAEEEEPEAISALIRDYQEYCREVGKFELDQECMDLLRELDESL